MRVPGNTSYLAGFVFSVCLTSALAAQSNYPAEVYFFNTLGLGGSGEHSYVDRFPGNDLLPYTEDDVALPTRGNIGGTWGFAHHDLNSDGAITPDEHIFAVIRRGDDDTFSFSSMSRPEHGVIYESEDWIDYHDARNDGPSACCPGDLAAEGNDFEFNDRPDWEGESNAYLYNNYRANQHGKGKARYYFENINPGSKAAGGEPWVYDEIEGYRKPLNFQHNYDDPGTAFKEADAPCDDSYMRSYEATIRGYLIPVAELENLENGQLPTLFGWETVDLAAYLRDTIAPLLFDADLNIFTDAGLPSDALPPTHLMLLQIQGPIEVNVGGTCSSGQGQADAMAAYWGIPPAGATARACHLLGFNADLTADLFGDAIRPWLDEPENGEELTAWILDHFFRDDSQHIGRYQMSGAPWSIEPDRNFSIIDNTVNKVLVTSTNGGPASLLAPLPRAMKAGEEVFVVMDLGDGNLGEHTSPGGGIHQIILQEGERVIAYAEITPDDTSVNLGGALDADGFAEDPEGGQTGSEVPLEDLSLGFFTRLVLHVTHERISLLSALDYLPNQFDLLAPEYTELASMEANFPCCADSLRFSTNGGIKGSLGVSTLAVFSAPPEGLQTPGDCNQDSELDLSDAICLLWRLFLDGQSSLPCGNSINDQGNIDLLSLNGDGTLDVSDVTYLLTYLFLGGEPPKQGTSCMLIPGCPGTCF